MTAIEIGIIVAGTVALLTVSWAVSLKAGRYHGVYRFFAFESILLLLLLNWRYWFVAPWSWFQIASWLLLCGSVVPAILGFRLLRIIGKPREQFEDTTKLVTEGIYRYIRHPLYASLMLLGFGICFKQLSLLALLLALVNTVALIATARREEAEMLQKFGQEYDAYMQSTKRFIPFIL